jgi:hypothetical protein
LHLLLYHRHLRTAREARIAGVSSVTHH